MESTFKEFLAGSIVAHPRFMSGSEMLRSEASLTSQRSRREKGTRFVGISYYFCAANMNIFFIDKKKLT